MTFSGLQRETVGQAALNDVIRLDLQRKPLTAQPKKGHQTGRPDERDTVIAVALLLPTL